MIDLEQSLRAAIEAATKTSYDAVEAAIQALYDEFAKAHAAYADAMADRLAVVRGEKPARGLPDVADGPQGHLTVDGTVAHMVATGAVALATSADEDSTVDGAIKQASE